MEYYRFRIKPLSPFATNPSSDTLAGQICYVLNLLGEDLDMLLKDYESDPFFVVSDMLPFGRGRAFRLPPHNVNRNADKKTRLDNMAKRKTDKKRDRISIDQLLIGKAAENCFLSNKEEIVMQSSYTMRNSINRLTGATGEDGFTPYSAFETFMADDLYFELFAYIKADYKDTIIHAIKKIGQVGFGKDASTGRGRFQVESEGIVEVNTENKDALYTLGNCVLEGMGYNEAYYDVCTRFGKHGAGTDKPFKNPVVMARQGALIYMPQPAKPYIGKGLRGISADEKAIHQGCSLYIPVNPAEAADE